MSDWRIFTGSGQPHDLIEGLPEAPSWRRFEEDAEALTMLKVPTKLTRKEEQRGKTFRVSPEHTDLVNVVNAALYLRRPLLITGKPGTGKTSLAYAIAYELKLGPVLPWSITARSSLQEGQYRYDAISRLQDTQIKPNGQKPQEGEANPDIGRYIQLGPLGTALLPYKRPRVLLIDEFDKSDINLPNDLLNLFEEGEFEIPELARLAKQVEQVNVRTYDGQEATIKAGRVRCAAFPFIVLTSNGERDFPPAFLRRCLRLTMPNPDEKALTEMVKAHLGENEDVLQQAEPLIADFLQKRLQGESKGDLSPDQLLNAVYLVTQRFSPTDAAQQKQFTDLLWKYLTSTEDG
ncbi:AAA family ATPase [Phormidium sp. CLA17]|uniref:AAA family ATPase n=1 Tax=Leptolyngbya sp. Cla-17 TaxID=2803751 RepID=UPI0014922848|nr:MoxR family ATPase [Leptolyngbya sp. Cla-17]MBM0740414.1 AAA family ATPase [Leptolyngbya sp. Cla-17]